MVNLLYASLATILFTFLNALFDAFKIKWDWEIHHTYEGISQAVILALIAYFSIYDINTHLRDINAYIALKRFFFCLAFFWLWFDYLLNALRTALGDKVYWWHLGSAWFDQILKGYKNRFYRLGLKILLVIITVII